MVFNVSENSALSIFCRYQHSKNFAVGFNFLNCFPVPELTFGDLAILIGNICQNMLFGDDG